LHGKSLLIQITDLPLYKINKRVNQVSFNRNQNKLRVDQSGSAPGRHPIRALRRHWNNRKYDAGHLRFPHA